jgi:electron transport complex protein RnfB
LNSPIAGIAASAELTTLLYGIALLALLALAITIVLGQARRLLPADDSVLIETLNALLPQTQCAQCGYPGCRPYAVALTQGEAINLCPPGGPETQLELAQLLGVAIETTVTSAIRQTAVIDETNCIGCALCVSACPVDAILGAPKFMHSILTQHCTGCELCVEPCPVDCISLVAAAQ